MPDNFEEQPRLQDDAMKVELRGYEVARLVVGAKNEERWAQTGAYRPTIHGWNKAKQDAGWLAEKHPKETYRVRAICSFEPPQAVEQQPAPADTRAASAFAGVDRTAVPKAEGDGNG